MCVFSFECTLCCCDGIEILLYMALTIFFVFLWFLVTTDQHRNRVKNQHRDKQVSRQEGYLRALEDARKGGVEYYDRPPK